VCEAIRDDKGRDDMIVYAEINATDQERLSLVDVYESLLKHKIGIAVFVKLVAEGELTAMTQVDIRQKPIRLIDNRFT